MNRRTETRVCQSLYFMARKLINSKELLLESLILEINLKMLFNIIKEQDTAWISYDSLFAWL